MARKAAETKAKTVKKTPAKKKKVSPSELNDLQSTQLNRINNLLSGKQKAIVPVIIAVIVLVALVAYIFRGAFVAAIVNGEPITRLSVVKALESQSGKATLESMVTKKLILQEAEKRNVDVTKADIDSEIKKIEDNLKTQGTTLDEALQLQGMTRDQLINEIQIQIALQRLVSKDVKVSDKEIEEYVTTNKDSFQEGTTEEEMKKQAEEQLKSQKLQENTQKFIEELQKKAKINYFVSY